MPPRKRERPDLASDDVIVRVVATALHKGMDAAQDQHAVSRKCVEAYQEIVRGRLELNARVEKAVSKMVRDDEMKRMSTVARQAAVKDAAWTDVGDWKSVRTIALQIGLQRFAELAKDADDLDKLSKAIERIGNLDIAVQVLTQPVKGHDVLAYGNDRQGSGNGPDAGPPKPPGPAIN